MFIGNVPFDYGEDEVADLVKPHAEVASVVLVLQPDGRSKGYAFVDLVKAGEAEKVRKLQRAAGLLCPALAVLLTLNLRGVGDRGTEWPGAERPQPQRCHGREKVTRR